MAENAGTFLITDCCVLFPPGITVRSKSGGVQNKDKMKHVMWTLLLFGPSIFMAHKMYCTVQARFYMQAL